MGFKFIHLCLYKGHIREVHVKMKAEVRVMHEQAKNDLETPEAGKGNEQTLP